MGADDGDDRSMMMTMMIMVMGMLFMHTQRDPANSRMEEVRGKCERVQRSVGYVKVWKQWFQRIMQIYIVFI